MINKERLSQKASQMSGEEILEEINYWNFSSKFWEGTNSEIANEAINDNLETKQILSEELCKKLNL